MTPDLTPGPRRSRRLLKRQHDQLDDQPAADVVQSTPIPLSQASAPGQAPPEGRPPKKARVRPPITAAGLGPWREPESDWSLPSGDAADLAEDVWKQWLPDQDWESRGQKQAGWRPGDDADLIRRPARSYEGERVTQILIHLSDTLLSMLKQGKIKAVEVQAMFVNGRVLLSENTKGGRDKLEATLKDVALAQVAGEVRKHIRKEARAKVKRGRKTLRAQSRPVTAEQVRAAIPPTKRKPYRHAGKFTRGIDLKRTWQQPRANKAREAEADRADELIEVLRQKIGDGEELIVRRAAGHAGLIDGDDHLGKVIIVDGRNTFHAEQNLMWALKLSGSKAPATIAGVKRPCLGCYLTFRVMAEVYRFPITFNPHHGFAWAESIRNVKSFIENPSTEPPRGAPQAGLDDESKEGVNGLRKFFKGEVTPQGYVSSSVDARGVARDDPGHASESDSGSDSDG